jgi:hypothetical protein
MSNDLTSYLLTDEQCREYKACIRTLLKFLLISMSGNVHNFSSSLKLMFVLVCNSMLILFLLVSISAG